VLSPVTTALWKEYELLDSGGFEKLERFGDRILIRPEPQAIWNKALPEEVWHELHHARYVRTKGSASDAGYLDDKGHWTFKAKLPERWTVPFIHEDLRMSFLLACTSFGHVGLFPEQAENWRYIRHAVKSLGMEKPAVLNLFAYTGGSTLAASLTGASVTHLDSVRQVINWANDNCRANNISDVRWVVEDARKFVDREVRRGNKYHGIILDPPAYGRGPEGEKWVLQEHLHDLLASCRKLLHPAGSFLVFSMYSIGFSSLVADNLVKSLFGDTERETGELVVHSRTGQKLPLGTVVRFRR
jgi:23S rRNA (cytosine1962-C5)-methyltransferase